MPKLKKVILLIETSREYGRGILLGIAKYARIYGPWVFYEEPGGKEISMPKLGNWGANGIIARISDNSYINKINPNHIPMIVLPGTEPIPNVPNIMEDSSATGFLVAKHLLDRGFQNFAFCGFDEYIWSQKRGQGFKQSLSEAGFEISFYRQPKSKTKCLWQNEQLVLAAWLKSLPKPVGVMACNDVRAKHVIEACKTANIKIPDQVAVIGVDDDKILCELSFPPLSSVAFNTEKAGYEAAEMLDKLMTGRKISDQTIIVHPQQIVTRQSTDILAVEDKEVADALRFIRENSNRPLRVSDVAEAAAVYRRGLERKFRKILNRSVYDEINKTRLNHVAKLLIETNLGLKKIAMIAGYPSVKQMSRSFKKEKKMSPLKYRQIYGRHYL